MERNPRDAQAIIHQPGGDVVPRVAFGAHRVQLGSQQGNGLLLADGGLVMGWNLVEKVPEFVQLGHRNLGRWFGCHVKRSRFGNGGSVDVDCIAVER